MPVTERVRAKPETGRAVATWLNPSASDATPLSSALGRRGLVHSSDSTLSLLSVRDGIPEDMTQRGRRVHCPCAHVKLDVDGLITSKIRAERGVESAAAHTTLFGYATLLARRTRVTADRHQRLALTIHVSWDSACEGSASLLA